MYITVIYDHFPNHQPNPSGIRKKVEKHKTKILIKMKLEMGFSLSGVIKHNWNTNQRILFYISMKYLWCAFQMEFVLENEKLF